MKNPFPGFPPEGQFWQFPTIINGFIHTLSGAEFKVLWYILRHTYGYQKEADAISIKQLMFGIKKKNGTMVDGGTGIKHHITISRAVLALEKKGFITYKKIDGKTTIYKPLIRKTGMSISDIPTLSLSDMVPMIKSDTTIYNQYKSNSNTITPASSAGSSNNPPIKRKNPCPLGEGGHPTCISFLRALAEIKNLPRGWLNLPKQITFLHKIVRAGYTFPQIHAVAVEMDSNNFMWDKWDLATIASQIEKKGETINNAANG